MKSITKKIWIPLFRVLPVLLIFLLFQHQTLKAQETGADEKVKLQQFEDAITRGEQFLLAKDYANAKAEYQKALQIDPSAKYPKEKLTYIRKFYIDPSDEARFTMAMESGNNFMSTADYVSAHNQFEIAVNLKPEDKTAREKLAEAEKLNLNKQEIQKQYSKLIAEADKLYSAGDLVNARVAYDAASKTDPEASYPRTRISEIDSKTAADKAIKESYEKTLADGDEAYMNRDFATARLKYELALKIKPGENYPKSMLERVSEGSAQLKDAQQNYQSAISGADKLFNAKDYETALLAYQNASKILPGEPYPTQQIEKINAIILQKKKLEDDYAGTISAGNQFFDAKQYTNARTEFQKANDLKPGEAYPKQKIEEIAVLLLAIKEAERNKAYNDLISEADILSDAKKYPEALTKYQEATIIKPEESYPKERIASINKLTTEAQTAGAAYNKAITDADLKYTASEYEEAISLYQSALDIRQEESYPLQQITKAREAIAANKQKEESYNLAIASGDKSMNSGNYDDALGSYQQALSIKPEATYPKEQIGKINAAIAANRSKEEQYQKLIEDADQRYSAGNYQESVVLFTQALDLKPQEKYPADKIGEINGLIEAQSIKQTNYNEKIALADKYFNEAEFEKALVNYNEATVILPLEKYPQEKIAVINSIFEQRKSLEENYTKNISEADNAFKSNENEKALKLYEQAKALKPAEKYPQDQINLLGKRLSDQKILDDKYQQIIAEADRFFNAGNFNDAAVKYIEARGLKPSEEYPQSQIGIINNHISDQKETDEKYRLLIIEADGFYNQKKADIALPKYQEALSLKPSEIYPAEQIAKINAMNTEIAQADQAYNEVITRADKFFDEGLLDEASVAYHQASDLKPLEMHPKDRITLIELKKSALRSLEENYQAFISEADRIFEAKDYAGALIPYQKALSLKPAESHPQQRIAEINTILLEQKQLADKDYNDAIESANRLFTLQDYTSAIKGYETASAIRPAEAYPKNKLIEINTILMERSRNQLDVYNKIIMQADLAYQEKIYDQAIDFYEDAKAAKPDEIYPDEMIRKIRQYMEDHSMVDLVSTPILISADSEQKFRFNPIEMRLRKNNYIIIKARKTGETEPKVYLNYGIDGQKSGGIVLRSIKSQETGDYLVRVSVQDRWYRLDNNWISVYSEGGDVEISRMQVAQGD